MSTVPLILEMPKILCSGLTKKGACKRAVTTAGAFCASHGKTAEAVPKVDHYTEAILRRHFLLQKHYAENIIELQKETGVNFRSSSIPEAISENIIKFILRNKRGDTTCRWNTDAGDLASDLEGVQECKCFTSDGPLSFTPKTGWDVIYFLDARKWLENKFALWRVDLKWTSPEWKAIQVNKAQTFEDQVAQGRRPRGNWEKVLLPQFGEHAQKIWEGSFEDIFTAPEEESADAPDE